MGIIREIHKWLEPYKYDNEVEVPSKKKTNKKKQVKVGKITKSDKKPTELDAVNRGELGIKIITLNNVMNENTAFQKMNNSASHIAYYFHSSTKHQIAARFEPASGFRYYKRNDIKRKNFKPVIYNKYSASDKTHLIPVGFHGSENDPRLLIGWSRKLNRGGIKKHEEKVININKDYTIFWFVDVEKTSNGSAKWTSTVWFEDGNIVDKKTFYDKDKYHWPS
ncbi:hypothetical protein [Staphylococcus caprae]|uniref:hypothetical protein n=1 Tax=Staphylococcus caprae TaxID=29380 RepID=UPI003B20B8B1